MVTAQHECWLRGSAIHLGPQIIQILCKKLLSCFFLLLLFVDCLKCHNGPTKQSQIEASCLVKYLTKNSSWKLKFENGQNTASSLTFVGAFSQRVLYRADRFRYFTQAESLFSGQCEFNLFRLGGSSLRKTIFFGGCCHSDMTKCEV